ncbi:chromosome segregation protein SMC [Virgibacillus soli]|uniref:chromosome segregation protein SMC n=1 Tax=Paracerasibacillus soli TaxID=480284 RepID=UPI0035E6B26B
MFLKRLESVGFKSFAERISVEFVPGVTAVVGPNGSGKSNITDAIRWVLGEQSARSLRGSKMEDIIFQGSDTRKRLNVAEVTLTLDNSKQILPLDYAEISVTRRVYRSGESEFYINKQPCRLKDIVDLFMDSGLGREAFSIISQGKVEEILSSKAEDRRTIFEEAAGVLKYKQRKKKAEFKLMETGENLNRVEDIIHEIEQQIMPLEKQAETAKKYLHLKDELKGNEISLLITEIEQLHVEWKALHDEIESQRMKDIQLKTMIQSKQADIEQKKQGLTTLDEEVERFQSQLLDVTQRLEQYEGKKRVFNERLKHFTENKQKLASQKANLDSRIKELKMDLSKETAELNQLVQQRKTTNEQVKSLEMKLKMDQADLEEKIEDLKAEYIEYLNEQAAKRNEKQSILQQLNQTMARTDRQHDRYQDLLSEVDTLNKRKLIEEKELHEAEKRYAVKEETIQRLKAEHIVEKQKYEEHREKLYQGYQIIEKLKSKKEMLEDMKEDYQGFFQGVKAVLKAREDGGLDDIYGAVVELIDVPTSYITAFETILGGQAQHIVVQHSEAARKAIQWLKRTNQGRATFLPLQSIQPRFITQDLLSKIKQHAGFVGVASDLITTDVKYKKAVQHLMGHVLIAKNLKDANEIAELAMHRYRIVTLDGDVVNPGGSMTGGAQRKTSQSLFTRDKELKNTTKKYDEYVLKVEHFEKTVANLKNHVAEINTELDKLEGEVYRDYQLLQQKTTVVNEIETKEATLKDNLTIYTQEKAQYTDEKVRLTTRDKDLTNQLENLEQQIKQIQVQIEDFTKQQVAFKESKEKLQNECNKMKILLAEQDERIKYQREKSNATLNQREDLEKQYALCTKELRELMEMKDAELTEDEIVSKIAQMKQKKEELIDIIQQKRSERVEQTKRMQDEERELNEETKQHRKHIEMIQQKELKQTRLDVDLENRLQHLQDEYTITYERAADTYEKVADVSNAKDIVKQLKGKIDALGTVNIGAIDEFERISERYEFLTSQRTDLLQAKQTLFDVIAEMDTEMEKLFEETFTHIKDEFSVVFKELFGGGRAELKLTNPTHLLDTGVEIIAQPPGKKLQHLGLLSGGERALTAIALLFAILRVRPVPFCVLDEVEAALDEANVVRFAKYLKMHRDSTQFIVITHRKGTMEEADVLYGVTMQESGVSRLVSVRLEETKELVNA